MGCWPWSASVPPSAGHKHAPVSILPWGHQLKYLCAHCPQTFTCSCTHTLQSHPSRSPLPAGLALGKLQVGGQTGPTWARQPRARPIPDPPAAPPLLVSLCLCFHLSVSLGFCRSPCLCGPPLSRLHPTVPEGQSGDSRTRAALPAARDKPARGPGGFVPNGPRPAPWPRPAAPSGPAGRFHSGAPPPRSNGRAVDCSGRRGPAAREPRAGGGRAARPCAAACGWAWRGCCWHGRPAPRGPQAAPGDRAATHTWRAMCAGDASSPPPTSFCAWTPAAACRAPAGATALTVSRGGAAPTGSGGGRSGQRGRRYERQSNRHDELAQPLPRAPRVSGATLLV